MKAFIGGFLGFECKEGQKGLIINFFFPTRFFDPRV